MALGDIAKVPAPVTEWCVLGARMIVMAALVISALIILGFVLAQTQLPPEIGANQAELKTAGITGWPVLIPLPKDELCASSWNLAAREEVDAAG